MNKIFSALALTALMAAMLLTASPASAYTAPKQALTGSGVNQGDLVTALQNIADLENELQDDHATFRTVIADNKALLNQIRQLTLYGVLGNPGFVISTNFDVKNGNAISYVNGGTLKSLAVNTNFDTGTAATCAASKYCAGMLTVTSGGTATVTWATAAGAGYNSEALAIAALAAPSATDTVLGYFTIQAHASGFTAGTDALTTGTGGNVATATTYYNVINPNTLMLGAAVSTSAPAALTNSTAISLSP